MFPSWKELFSILFTFGLAVIGWIFFRAADIHQAFSYLGKIFSRGLFTVPELPTAKTIFLTIFILIVIEWIGRQRSFALEGIGRLPAPARWLFYYAIIISI